MPFIADIIVIADNHLKAKCLCDSVFTGALYAGIAYDATREDEETKRIETFPVTQQLSGEQTDVSINDMFPLITYHKILSTSSKPVGGFGATNSDERKTIDVRMVVASYTDVVSLSQENLEALITSNFPDNIPRTLFPQDVHRICFTYKGSILDKQQVWALEYKNIPYSVKPNQILFALLYSIEVDYRKGCLTLSDCQRNSEAYY